MKITILELNILGSVKYNPKVLTENNIDGCTLDDVDRSCRKLLDYGFISSYRPMYADDKLFACNIGKITKAGRNFTNQNNIISD